MKKICSRKWYNTRGMHMQNFFYYGVDISVHPLRSHNSLIIVKVFTPLKFFRALTALNYLIAILKVSQDKIVTGY